MSYRTYLGIITRTEYEAIKTMDAQQLHSHYGLQENDGYINVGIRQFVKQLYEFGKNFNTYNHLQRFFDNEELSDYFNSDTSLYVANNEFLKYAIDIYNERIRKYYDEMRKPFIEDSAFLDSRKINMGNSIHERNSSFDFSKMTQSQKNALMNMINHIESVCMEWNDVPPYNLNDGISITDSWRFEYEIFELVRIYKSFDWENDVLIYFGC